MSEPLTATPASRSGARLFHTLSLRRHASMFALLAISGAMLVCAPVGANEIAANRTPSSPPAAAAAKTCSGAIWWSELLAADTEKLTDFYSKVIGWNVKIVDAEDQSQPPSSPDNRYTIFSSGDDQVAGLMKANHPVAAHPGLGWFTYIQVADVDATAEKVEASGGSVLRHPVDTETGDRIAVVSDPMGNVFGIVTPAEKDC